MVKLWSAVETDPVASAAIVRRSTRPAHVARPPKWEFQPRCATMMLSSTSFFRAMLIGSVLAAGAANACVADDEDQPPTVLLKGEAVSELAPHGAGNIYAPDVLKEGKLYRMWYGGQGKDGHDRIHYAESADGLSWTRKGVVLEDPKANHVNDPSVVKVRDMYFMYYTHTEKDVIDRIDVATSKDGLKWEPQGVALAGRDGAWDAVSVGRPAVIYEDGLFKMWYDGRKDFPPDAPVQGVPKSGKSKRSVGYATSQDGLRWTREGTGPSFGNDAGGLDVKRVGDQLVMVYESFEGTGMALSRDGINWSNEGFLAEATGVGTDLFGHVTPCLFVDAGAAAARLYVGWPESPLWNRNSIGMLTIPMEHLRGKSEEAAANK